MKVNVLRKGDSVLNVTSEFIAIKRRNGEVDIMPVVEDVSGFRINTEAVVTIGYGENTIESDVVDGVIITNF